jgi:hypothetical protein
MSSMNASAAPTPHVFAYPWLVRAFAVASAVMTLVLLVIGLAAQSRLLSLDGLLDIGLLLFLDLLTCLYLQRRRVELDREGITCHGIIGSRRIRWKDIDDLHCSSRLILLSADSRVRLRLFRGDRGLALEPFDVLQQQLADRLQARLADEWAHVPLPRSYRYPKLSPGALIAYAIPIGLLILFFVVFSVGVDGFWLEKLTFLALGLGAVLPFIARDYLRSRRWLELSAEGLRETNGKLVSIGWSSIGRLIVREPISIGFGSIDVVSVEGDRIRIPRALSRLGELLHLLNRYSGVETSYSYDY